MSQHLLAFDDRTVYNSFFIKIKTVTEYPNVMDFKENDPNGYDMFLNIFKINDGVIDNYIEQIYQNKAIYNPNFSKISAICFGFFHIDEERGVVNEKIKSIIKSSEKDMIRIFWQVLNRLYENNKNKILVGHNIIKFDIPFYIKRLLKYRKELFVEDNDGNKFQMGIPNIFKKMLIAKPWEQAVVDTSDIWKFGERANPSIIEIERFVGYKRDDKEILNENMNKYYWDVEPENREETMKDIAMIGSSDIKIMMDFMIEMKNM